MKEELFYTICEYSKMDETFTDFIFPDGVEESEAQNVLDAFNCERTFYNMEVLEQD